MLLPNARRFALLTCSALLAQPLRAQCPSPDWIPGFGVPGVAGEANNFSATVGEINASILWDPDGAGPLAPRLVVGGTFAYAGNVRASSIAQWDGARWSVLGTGLDGPVLALTVLPDNRLVAGGAFSTAGGVPASNVAVWDGAAWAELGSGMDGTVSALVTRANGHIVAGGSFQIAGSSLARGIARWDGVDWRAIDTGVRAGASGNTAGVVDALALHPNGDLFVGGLFDRADLVPAANVARLRFAANGTTSTWFALGAGTNDFVSDIDVLANGDLAVGGSFSSAGGNPASFIARWNGAAWSALGSGMDDAVISLTQLANGNIVAGGIFEAAGGLPQRGIAQWNGTAWVAVGDLGPFHATLYDSAVYSVLTLSNGDLFAGGVLESGGMRWDGSSWRTFGAGFNADVFEVAAGPSGEVYAAGAFDRAGNVLARGIARFDGVAWSPLGTGIQFVPTALLPVSSSLVYAAGLEVPFGGGATVGIFARWNGTAWQTLQAGFKAFALGRLPNGDIVATGNDALVGGVYRWTGASWSLIGAPFSNAGGFAQPEALVVLPNGDIVVGGTFDDAGGVAVNNVARWNGTAWTALGAGVGDPANFEGVTALTRLPNGDVVAGGQFASDVNGVNQFHGVARWNGAAWQPMGLGLDDCCVFAMTTLADGRVVAGGAFTDGLSVWDGFNWAPIGPVVEGTTSSLAALPNGDFALGGNFAFVGGVSSARFAIYGCSGVGTGYCATALNSTGNPGRLTATGSSIAAANSLQLVASDLPVQSFGFFVTSATQGFVANPGGSQGNLCLGGGIGRYVGPGQVKNSGAQGLFSLALNLAQTPTPSGFVTVMAGQSRNFQGWYRDAVSGTTTSNFTNGLAVAFQ